MVQHVSLKTSTGKVDIDKYGFKFLGGEDKKERQLL